MFNFIDGKVVARQEGFIVLDHNGIGFEIGVSNNTLVEIQNIQDTVRIYTYLQVKEDGISLYGFASEHEKSMFLKLITVSGVGPKSAMAILSSMPLVDLVDCIINQSVTLLSRAKGIGKKTAERLVLELKDKIDVFTSIGGLEMPSVPNVFDCQDRASQDAIELLTNLGISLQKAKQLVASVRPICNTTEEIIKKAFEEMNG